MEVRDFQLSVVVVMVLTISRQLLRTNNRQDLEQKLRAVVSDINNHADYSTTPTFITRLEFQRRVLLILSCLCRLEKSGDGIRNITYTKILRCRHHSHAKSWQM